MGYRQPDSQRPDDQRQLVFLDNLQRLLAEGGFVATYKFALLLALADVAVEHGDDSGGSMHVGLEQLGEQFVRLYWRQAERHPRGGVLEQNTGHSATILRLLIDARSQHCDSLNALRSDERAWRSLVRKVASVVGG